MTDERGRFSRVHLVVERPDRPGAGGASRERGRRLAVAGADGGRGARAARPGSSRRRTGSTPTVCPAGRTPVQLELLRRLGLGAAMIVPLRARDRVIGVLCLVHADEFTPDAVVTAAHLGRRAGLALDNVRLLLAERSAALTLQQSLLPTITDVPGLDVATAYVPSGRHAQVGGDWFDVLPLPDGTVGLAVGDVVGHDLRAAASMGQLRSLLRSYAWEGSSPAAVLSRADELVRGLDIADIATCVYLRWSSRDGRRRVTSPTPGPGTRHRCCACRAGRWSRSTGGLSTPVGLAGPGGAEASIDVPPGAVLVLYTDGLVERRDRGLREGIAALADQLAGTPEGASAATIRDQLVATLVGTLPGGRRVPAGGQGRLAHQASSSARAASGPSGPRSIRSSSRCLYASPTSRPGGDPEDRHDLRAVQVRADRVELLLLRERGDPAARGRRTRRTAERPCARSAWCSRSGSAGAGARAAGRRR